MPGRLIRLSDWPFLIKFGVGPGLALAALAALAWLGVDQIGRQSVTIDQLVHDKAAGTLLQGIVKDVLDINGHMFRALAVHAAQSGDGKAVEDLQALTLRTDGVILALTTFRDQYATDAQKPEINVLAADIGKYRGAIDWVSQMLEVDFGAAVSFLQPFDAVFATMNQRLTTMVGEFDARSRAAAVAAASGADATRVTFIWATAGAVALVLPLATLIATATTRSIRRIARATAGLAQGDTDTDTTHLDRGDELGAIVRSLQVFRDDQIRVRALQAEQAAVQRHAEAARARSAFLANMSHEIRTPMNAILGLAQLLKKCTLGPAEQDMVGKICNAGRTLLGIINDILDFSKIEAGRMELEQAPFRLDTVLDNIATIMGAAVGTKDVELIVGPVPEEAMFLQGDALRLEQVLINLTSNAIKFTEAGEVALTIAVVATRPGQVDLRFAVRDTGIGIPPEKQEEIFSAFSQADNSTTRRFGGSGLGLTITRRIVTLMGGSISLTSTAGQGSEFSFVIPLALDQPGGLPPFLSLAGQRVLIADDHALAREMLADMAASMGWSPVVVADGEAAVTQALAAIEAGRPFDVLLLDWKMPGLDGLTAAAGLRVALGDRPAPTIIVITAHSLEHLVQHSQAGVADTILAKPVTASTMYNAVCQARRQAAGRPEESTGPRAGGQLTGLTILVVDDSDINRDVARLILENEGAQVLLAADGGQALAVLRQAPPQVNMVLMDVQMPVMDGYEATQYIRHSLHLTDLPVIALTAGAFQSQQQAAFEAGMNGFVPKPFEVADLIATVLRLSGRPAAPATSVPASTAAQPPIDLARGLRTWGSSAILHKYLRRFAASHGQDDEEIVRLLARGQREEAAALVHKLKGAAGGVALMTVWRQADQLEQTFQLGDDPAPRLQGLQAALAAARSAIAAVGGPDQQAPAATKPDDSALARCCPGLLDELLAALDHDNPDEAEPILDGLSGKLPAEWLAALRERLDAFDFRGAERFARAIAGGEALP